MLLAGIRDHIYKFSAVTQRPELIDGQKRCSGKICFHSQHTIQFNRMSHRLVNLQPELRAVENDVEFPFRTLIGMMQCDCLFGNAPRVLHQFQFLDQFISFVLPLSAIRVGIRPLLYLAPGKRIGRVSRARRKLGLMNVGALRRHKPLLFAIEVQIGLRQSNSCHRAQLRVNLQ